MGRQVGALCVWDFALCCCLQKKRKAKNNFSCSGCLRGVYKMNTWIPAIREITQVLYILYLAIASVGGHRCKCHSFALHCTTGTVRGRAQRSLFSLTDRQLVSLTSQLWQRWTYELHRQKQTWRKIHLTVKKEKEKLIYCMGFFFTSQGNQQGTDSSPALCCE